MRVALLLSALLVLAACDQSQEKKQTQERDHSAVAYVLPSEILIDAAAERGPAGEIIITGSTNLPDGTVVGVEIPRPDGRIGPQDLKIPVKNGKFRSSGFTNVDAPFSSGKHKVHLLSYFNGAWQTPEILKIVGDGGSYLNGPAIKLKDPELTDSDKIVDSILSIAFPEMDASAKAITLVKRTTLTVDGTRSSTNVQDSVDYFMTFPGLRVADGWSAQPTSEGKYLVSFSFVDGKLGVAQAIWEVDTSTKRVRYTNKAAKAFSYTPNY